MIFLKFSASEISKENKKSSSFLLTSSVGLGSFGLGFLVKKAVGDKNIDLTKYKYIEDFNKLKKEIEVLEQKLSSLKNKSVAKTDHSKDYNEKSGLLEKEKQKNNLSELTNNYSQQEQKTYNERYKYINSQDTSFKTVLNKTQVLEAQSEHTLLFACSNRRALVHTLAIPKGLYRNFSHFQVCASTEEKKDFWDTIQKHIKDKVLETNGYRLKTNMGKDERDQNGHRILTHNIAYQATQHFHVHILGGGFLPGHTKIDD